MDGLTCRRAWQSYRGEGWEKVTHTPLIADVNGNQRMFRIIFKPKNPSLDVEVKAIPRNAAIAQSPNTMGPPTPESPGFNTYRIQTKSDILDLRPAKRSAIAEVQRTDGKNLNVPVGKTEHYGDDVIIA